jgi:hypothetical protein
MFASFKDYAKNLKPVLDAAFTGHLTRLLGNGGPRGSALETELLAGGKKIRGSLLCLVASTLGGALEDALPRAVAVELIQAATLIHDDFVDQHRSRRNRASAWTLEGGRRAVLLGDIVFASAIHMMSEMGRDDGLIVSRAIAEVSSGAYQEPLNPSSLLEAIEGSRIDTEMYLKIISLKTGVLFGAACELGAVAAMANDKIRRSWRRYGLKIGEAYQIADDLHDVEQCLLNHCVRGSEIAGLAPALLFFAGESRACIINALRRERSDLSGEILLHFRTAAELMKAEKERRLQSAVEGIVKDSADSDIYRLALKTPWDIISMFDEATPPVSLRSR